MNTTALLYQHEDGRHAVAASAELATFASGDPKWHRVGPVDVSAVNASLPTASPAAEVIAGGNGLRLFRTLPAGTKLYAAPTPPAETLRAFVAITPLPYGAVGTRDVDIARWHAAHAAASAILDSWRLIAAPACTCCGCGGCKACLGSRKPCPKHATLPLEPDDTSLETSEADAR